jgi:hypothetical protein
VTAVYDENLGNFVGHQPRTCGEHRTVGPHRAWCFDGHLTDEELIALLIQVRDGDLTVEEAVRKILEP